MMSLMAIFKRQPKPKDCDLSNIKITSHIEKEYGQPTHTPIHDSEPYQKTLIAQGRYDDWYYRNQAGGKFKIETPVSERTVFTGAFSCRRTQNNPNLAAPAARRGFYEADVVGSVYEVAKQLGICATCPYLGMSEVEADQHDAVANGAEAERLQSERLLAVARKELDDFTSKNGGHIS